MFDRLAHWNALTSAAAAAAEVLPCNGSERWARLLAERRPIMTEAELQAHSDAIWLSLPQQDWLEAFATHPRIGERHSEAASSQALAWSGQEQAAAQDDRDTRLFQEANRDYEARFGRTFLICATGLTRIQILGSLKERLRNTPQQELVEAAEQQRRITCLRLKRWLEGR